MEHEELGFLYIYENREDRKIIRCASAEIKNFSIEGNMTTRTITNFARSTALSALINHNTRYRTMIKNKYQNFRAISQCNGGKNSAIRKQTQKKFVDS